MALLEQCFHWSFPGLRVVLTRCPRLSSLAFQCVMSAKILLNWRNEVCAAMELSLLMGAKLVHDLMFEVLSRIHMNLMNGIR